MRHKSDFDWLTFWLAVSMTIGTIFAICNIWLWNEPKEQEAESDVPKIERLDVIPKQEPMETIEAREVLVLADVAAEEETQEVFFREEIPLTAEEQIALKDACDRFDIDVSLMCGLIQKESQFTNIVGDNGRSIGYCQIQPRWWGNLMEEIGAEDLHTPADNFLTAAAILRRHYNAYGTWERALTAYNTGSAGVNGYARTVMRYWSEWTEKLESED